MAKKITKQNEIGERIGLADSEILNSDPAELSSKDFERYYSLKEIESAEIRKAPHKVLNGVPVAMTEAEIDEFNRLPEDNDEIVLKNLKATLILSRKKYLQETDWQAAALTKYGRPLDSEVPAKCLLANQEINEIEACKTLKALEAFREVFE